MSPPPHRRVRAGRFADRVAVAERRALQHAFADRGRFHYEEAVLQPASVTVAKRASKPDISVGPWPWEI